jgi:hypothetical protein
MTIRKNVARLGSFTLACLRAWTCCVSQLQTTAFAGLERWRACFKPLARGSILTWLFLAGGAVGAPPRQPPPAGWRGEGGTRGEPRQRDPYDSCSIEIWGQQRTVGCSPLAECHTEERR